MSETNRVGEMPEPLKFQRLVAPQFTLSDGDVQRVIGWAGLAESDAELDQADKALLLQLERHLFPDQVLIITPKNAEIAEVRS